MTMPLQLSRRAAVRLSAGGMLTACTLMDSRSGWLSALARGSEQGIRPAKRVILLWMNGGPSTIDLWDLKPEHENGGPFREINTNVPGLKISENLPLLAKHGDKLAIVRSMATREGDHQRARIVGLTGYTPQGAIQFPELGALVAHEVNQLHSALPGFVSIGPRNASIGGGFLGPRYAPFVISGESERRPSVRNTGLEIANLGLPSGLTEERYKNRLSLLAEIENQSTLGSGHPVIDAMKASTESATRLMRPEASAAFNLDEEPDSVRSAYGTGVFGQGCLLARRLVERGVSFVEVSLDGWDTHNNNFERVKTLSGTLDAAFATLLSDLQQRGLLEDTLVVCQGEFGRTPKINGQSGRDHWPSSWSVVLAGGGIRGGQVIGKTSADGTQVESEPTRTPDLIATVVSAIGLDPRKQNMSNVSRPIRLADPAGKPIEALL